MPKDFLKGIQDQYDVVVIGSSRAHTLNAATVDEVTGLTFFNGSNANSSNDEILLYLKIMADTTSLYSIDSPRIQWGWMNPALVSKISLLMTMISTALQLFIEVGLPQIHTVQNEHTWVTFKLLH